MNEETKVTLTNMDTWKRGLFMLAFAMISGLARLVVACVAIFQFITLLFKGQTNESLLPFAQNLSTYLYQITLFLTFKSDAMPFPFIDFPEGAPEPMAMDADKEDVANTEATTQSEAVILEADNTEIKDQVTQENDDKDEPLKS